MTSDRLSHTPGLTHITGHDPGDLEVLVSGTVRVVAGNAHVSLGVLVGSTAMGDVLNVVADSAGARRLVDVFGWLAADLVDMLEKGELA